MANPRDTPPQRFNLELFGLITMILSLVMFFGFLFAGLPGRPWAYIPIPVMILGGACLLIGQQIRIRRQR